MVVVGLKARGLEDRHERTAKDGIDQVHDPQLCVRHLKATLLEPLFLCQEADGLNRRGRHSRGRTRYQPQRVQA